MSEATQRTFNILSEATKNKSNNNNILNNNIMKHLKRKLMMTLALLMTAATSAWAESKPIGLNVEYEAGDEITSTTDVYVYYGEHPTNHKQMGVKITSTQPLKIFMITAHGFELNGDAAVYYLPDGDAEGGYAGGIPCIGESTGDATVVHVKSGSGTLTDPYVFGSGPSGTPVPLTRGTGEKINEWTLTNGMPAGNVTVNVKYFPQAEFAKSTDETLAPTAIADVPANTDAPIVTAGTVANIGTSEVKQGTLMYFVKQADGNTEPDAPTYTTEGWTDKVPTADGLQEGNAYVWYYIKGAEPANIADRSDDNTRSDSDIMPLGTNGYVTLAAEPTYDVTLNDEGLSTDEAAAWKVAKGTDDPAAFPLEGVKKGDKVTVTYSGTKKVLGVKAEKKAAEKTIKIGTQDYTVQKGETWKQFIERNELSDWLISPYDDTRWCVYMVGLVPPLTLLVSTDGTNWAQLILTSQDAPIDTDKQYNWGE